MATAKVKAKKKAKVRDLSAKKQVKGGLRRTGRSVRRRRGHVPPARLSARLGA